MKSRAVFGLIAMLPLTGICADAIDPWYFNPQIGGIVPDSKRALRDSLLWGVGLGMNLSQDWNAEINFSDSKLDYRRMPGQLNAYAGSLDTLRVFNRERVVASYISLGLGALSHLNGPNHYSSDFLAQAGAGLLIRVWQSSDGSRSFSLRPELKVRYDDDKSDSRGLFDYIATLGFQIGFGGPHAPASLAAMPPPSAQPPPQPQSQSKPRSKPQAEPDPPSARTISLQGVEFELNSATLTAASKPILDRVAAELRGHDYLRIEVQVHTDSVGSPEYNLALSRRRAVSVRDYLVAQQVPADELAATGYGMTEPVASNATADGRSLNRRVMLIVWANPNAAD